MKISAPLIAAGLLLAASSAHAQTADLAGTWRHTGTQQELVIRSVMEQRATYSMPGDFRPGGSTVISTRPVPTQVRRDMTLTIRPDGGFDWMSDKTYPESSSCNVTLRQQRAGNLTVNGTRGAFDIRQGSERSSRSCNGTVNEADRSGRTETYTISRSGSTLRLNDGTVTWIFTRAR